MTDLVEIIKYVKPTAILGLSTISVSVFERFECPAWILTYFANTGRVH